jgi:hypothetical protein
LELQPELPATVSGWRFSAPVVKEVEHRFDGLFQPPANRPELPAVNNPSASPLLRALALLIQPEREIPTSSAVLQAEVTGTKLEGAIADVIAAIVIARFNGWAIPDLCAMGGITLEDLTQSVAYKEIIGLGERRGLARGLEQASSTSPCVCCVVAAAACLLSKRHRSAPWAALAWKP